MYAGAYLIACGVRGAMLFVSWLGIKVLPLKNTDECHFPEKVCVISIICVYALI